MALEIEDFFDGYRFIILIDIIGYSELNDDEQLKIVNAITTITKDLIKDGGYGDKQYFESFIPTGDGFYIIGNDFDGIFWGQIFIIFALSLRNKFLQVNSETNLKCKGIKTAIHFGKANKFIDILDNHNFVGSGMNDTARMLSYDNKSEIDPIARSFYDHNNIVIISEAALSKSNKINSLKKSVDFNIIAKHRKEIKCNFIDALNGVVFHIFSPKTDI